MTSSTNRRNSKLQRFENVHSHIFTPRTHQIELIDQLSEGNIISCLDSESCKFFVTTTIIKELNLILPKRQHVLIIASNDSLCLQHIQLISTHTRFSVVHLQLTENSNNNTLSNFELHDQNSNKNSNFKNSADLSNSNNSSLSHVHQLDNKIKDFLNKIAKHRVIVATPDTCLLVGVNVLLSCLDLQLIIFDDCHIATKNCNYQSLVHQLFARNNQYSGTSHDFINDFKNGCIKNTDSEISWRCVALTSCILSHVEGRADKLVSFLENLEYLFRGRISISLSDLADHAVSEEIVTCEGNEDLTGLVKICNRALNQAIIILTSFNESREILMPQIIDNDNSEDLTEMDHKRITACNIVLVECLHVLNELGPWCFSKLAQLFLKQLTKLQEVEPVNNWKFDFVLTLLKSLSIKIEHQLFKQVYTLDELMKYVSVKVLNLIKVIHTSRPEDNFTINPAHQDLNINVDNGSQIDADNKLDENFENFEEDEESDDRDMNDHFSSDEDIEDVGANPWSSKLRNRETGIGVEGFSSLVFVKRKHVAYSLNKLLIELCNWDVDLYFVRSHYVAGNSEQMSSRELRRCEDALRKFRQREFNLLVTTNLLQAHLHGSESHQVSSYDQHSQYVYSREDMEIKNKQNLDVPKCNLVVSFDAPSSYEEFMGCKARARGNKCRYIVLVDSTQSDFKEKLEQYINIQKILEERKLRSGEYKTDYYDNFSISKNFNMTIQKESVNQQYTHDKCAHHPNKIKLYEANTDSITTCQCSHKRYTHELSTHQKCAKDDYKLLPNEINQLSQNDYNNILSNSNVNHNVFTHQVDIHTMCPHLIYKHMMSDKLSLAEIDKLHPTFCATPQTPILSLTNAIKILNKYCARLPSDSFTHLAPICTVRKVPIIHSKCIFHNVGKYGECDNFKISLEKDVDLINADEKPIYTNHVNDMNKYNKYGHYVETSNKYIKKNSMCNRNVNEIFYCSCDIQAFIAYLRVPINSPLRQEIKGLVMGTERLARMSVAWVACLALYHIGELDNNWEVAGKDRPVAQQLSLSNIKEKQEQCINEMQKKGSETQLHHHFTDIDNLDDIKSNRQSEQSHQFSIEIQSKSVDLTTHNQSQTSNFDNESDDNDDWQDPNLLCKPGSTKRKQHYLKKTADCLKGFVTADTPACLYGLTMQLTQPIPDEQNVKGRPIHDPGSSTRSFAIVTSNFLPKVDSFVLWSRCGEVSVSVDLLNSSLILDEQQILRLSRLHRFIFQQVLRVEKQPMIFLPKIAPIASLIVFINKDDQNSFEIDWPFINNVEKHDLYKTFLSQFKSSTNAQTEATTDNNQEQIKDKFIIESENMKNNKRRHKSKKFTVKISPSVNIDDNANGIESIVIDLPKIAELVTNVRCNESMETEGSQSTDAIPLVSDSVDNVNKIVMDTCVISNDFDAVLTPTNMSMDIEINKNDTFVFVENDFVDAVVTPSYRNVDQPQFFYVAEVRRDLSPLSPFPSPELYPTFFNYYQSKYSLTPSNVNQPLLDADHTSARLNLLTPRYINQKGVPLPTAMPHNRAAKRHSLQQKQILVPEFCVVHPIPASLWRKAVCLPTMLYRLNHLLVAQQWLKTIKEQANICPASQSGIQSQNIYNSINNSNFINQQENIYESVDQSQNYLDSISQTLNITHSIDQPVKDFGPSASDLMQTLMMSNANDLVNLERLETIGDSFLKYATTIHLYLKHKNVHEGRLSYLRSLQVSNYNLYRLGRRKGLSTSIIATKFEPLENWLPPAYIVPSLIDNSQTYSSYSADSSLIKNDINLQLESNSYSLKNKMTKNSNYNLNRKDANQENNDKCNYDGGYCLQTEQSVADKSIADCVEALIGCYLATTDHNNTLRLMRWLGLQVLTEEEPIKITSPLVDFFNITNFIQSSNNDTSSANPTNKSFIIADLSNNIHGQKKEIYPVKFLTSNSLISNNSDIFLNDSNIDKEKINNINQLANDDIFSSDCERNSCIKKLKNQLMNNPSNSFNNKTILNNINKINYTQSADKSINGAIISNDEDCINMESTNFCEGNMINSVKLVLCNDFITIDNENNCNCEINKVTKDLLDELLVGYDELEEKIGYKFQDRGYLLQAFTHASFHYNRFTDCYQRLEFLGDAILDYIITRYLFNDQVQHSPGVLTDLRSALVNNNIFASLSIKWGLDRYLRFLSPPLFHLLDRFSNWVKMHGEDAVLQSELEWERGEEGADIEIPKVLGDIFESLAGAIYLDSGCDLEVVWSVYYRLMHKHIKAFMENVPKSPVRELLELEPETAKFQKPERRLDGLVRVVVRVVGRGEFIGVGRNYRIAKTAAAKRALCYINSNL